jgi:hypothetical protein
MVAESPSCCPVNTRIRIQSTLTLSFKISFRLPYHQHQGLTSALFHSDFATKTLHALTSLVRATYTAQLFILDFTSLTMPVEGYSTDYKAPEPSPPLSPSISLTTPFFSPKFCFSLRMRFQFYGLLDDAVSSPKHTASKDRINNTENCI